MSILTKPSITKGTSATLTLDKASLAAIITNTNFQDTSSWKLVQLFYRSSTGNQKKTVNFDATEASPQASISFSLKAKDSFYIEKILVHDLDGDRCPIYRSSVATPSQLDIILSATAPTGTAYRYIKIKFLESYSSIGNPSNSNSVSITELQFKYDGSVQSLAGKTITANAGSVVPLTDGLMPTTNSGFWNVNFAANPEFIVDVGTAKTVTDILMAPQGSDPDQVYNSPKKFEVLGSNDNVTYTSIKLFDLAAPVLGTGAGQWQAGHLTSFSLAVVAGPAKFSASLARSTMTIAPDGLSISNARGDYMYNAYLDKPVTLATAGKFIVEFEIVNSISYLYFGGTFVSNVSEFAVNNFGEISNGWPLMSSAPEGNKGFNYSNGGPLYIGTTSSGVTFGGFTNGDKICLAIDTSNHKIWIGKNGVFPSAGDPATNTGGASYSSSATFAYLGLALSNGTVKVVTPSVIPTGFVQL